MILKNNVIIDNLIRNEHNPFQIDTTNGFIRGNIFNNLYKPYKNITTRLNTPTTKEEQLMSEINKYNFYTTELHLYLDLYPNDTNALNLFNQYSTQLNNLINTYENNFQVLTQDSKYLQSNTWKWLEGPWPWQN